MYLVDKNIKVAVENNQLITAGFVLANLKGIAYELTIDSIYDESNSPVSSFELNPRDIVYIKTAEEISLPENITARVVERNSVMRMGLRVDGPQYIPGHKTFCFLRVENISDHVISLNKTFKIAQVMFEELKDVPEQTYEKQDSASFQNEKEYIGAGKYQSEYNKLLKKINTEKEFLESVKDKLYANVLTIMGVFVSIFTLISVNIQAFSISQISNKLIATVNLCLLSCISVLMGFVMLIVHNKTKKWFIISYIIFICLLLFCTILFCIK